MTFIMLRLLLALTFALPARSVIGPENFFGDMMLALRGDNSHPCLSPDLFILIDRTFVTQQNYNKTALPILQLLAACVQRCDVRASVIEFSDTLDPAFTVLQANTTQAVLQKFDKFQVGADVGTVSYLAPALQLVSYQMVYMKGIDRSSLPVQGLVFVLIGRDPLDLGKSLEEVEMLRQIQAAVVVLNFGAAEAAKRLATKPYFAVDLPYNVDELAQTVIGTSTLLTNDLDKEPVITTTEGSSTTTWDSSPVPPTDKQNTEGTTVQVVTSRETSTEPATTSRTAVTTATEPTQVPVGTTAVPGATGSQATTTSRPTSPGPATSPSATGTQTVSTKPPELTTTAQPATVSAEAQIQTTSSSGPTTGSLDTGTKTVSTSPSATTTTEAPVQTTTKPVSTSPPATTTTEAPVQTTTKTVSTSPPETTTTEAPVQTTTKPESTSPPETTTTEAPVQPTTKTVSTGPPETTTTEAPVQTTTKPESTSPPVTTTTEAPVQTTTKPESTSPPVTTTTETPVQTTTKTVSTGPPETTTTEAPVQTTTKTVSTSPPETTLTNKPAVTTGTPISAGPTTSPSASGTETVPTTLFTTTTTKPGATSSGTSTSVDATTSPTSTGAQTAPQSPSTTTQPAATSQPVFTTPPPTTTSTPGSTTKAPAASGTQPGIVSTAVPTGAETVTNVPTQPTLSINHILPVLSTPGNSEVKARFTRRTRPTRPPPRLTTTSTLPNPEDASRFCFACLNRRNPKDLYANPNDCHTYYQCQYLNATSATAILRHCPGGTFWSEGVLGCLPEGSQPCFDRCQNKTIAAHGCYGVASDCAKFFVCSHGVSYAQCCPKLTRFSEVLCACTNDPGCVTDCSLTDKVIPETTMRPPSTDGDTCTDSYGNVMRPKKYSNSPIATAFEIIGNGPPVVLPCALGTSFDLKTCRCELAGPINQTAQPPDTLCQLYLPFDNDSQDHSSNLFTTFMYGLARMDSATSATSDGGSAYFVNGMMEVPGMKTKSFQDSASFCLFYRCKNPFDGSFACLKNGGLLSNCYDATRCDHSVVIAAENNRTVSADMRFTNPDNRVSLTAQYDSESADGWVQLCIVYDGTFVKMYINGAGVNAKAAAGNVAVSHCPLTIGNDYRHGPFRGFIDEVLICDHAMTSDEVKAHYVGDRKHLVDKGLIRN